MALIRSTLFALLLVLLTPPFALIAIATAPFPPLTRYRVISSWARMVMPLIRGLLGIRCRVVGLENLPSRPAVICAKHMSAWETIAFQTIFPPLGFVLKKELLKIPFFGWGLARMPGIAIDRAAGKDALAQLEEQGKTLLQEGICVVVFPEGTRVAPGMTRRYKPGGAWLASRSGAPVVPVAHNAGEFWRRNAFVKQPGEVVVSIGPAIDTAGLTPEEVNRRTEAWIEGEMKARFPHHYQGAQA